MRPSINAFIVKNRGNNSGVPGLQRGLAFNNSHSNRGTALTRLGVIRKIELEKILLPHFAAAVGARHVGEMCSAFQADRDVTEFGNHFEVSPGPAAKIKYCETRLALDVLQHRRNVLADIVIARACPELFGAGYNVPV